MKSIVALLCLAACAMAHNDGQWRGEGLAESQDNWNNGYGVWNGAWNGALNGAAYGYGNNDGQWRGEGLVESQDNWARNGWNNQWNQWNNQWNNGWNNAYAANNEGQWKGEGLAESQDNWRWNNWNNGWNNNQWNAVSYAGAYAHGAAPIGIDGRVVDTPEVAHAKAAHFAAKAAASHGSVAVVPSVALGYATPYAVGYAGSYAHGAAPIGIDGRVVDTPEVAHAKAAHFAAKAAANRHY